MLEETKKSLRHVLPEFCSGYILLAFEPRTGRPMMMAQAANPKTAMALNSLAIRLVEEGGIGVDAEAEEDEE